MNSPWHFKGEIALLLLVLLLLYDQYGTVTMLLLHFCDIWWHSHCGCIAPSVLTIFTIWCSTSWHLPQWSIQELCFSLFWKLGLLCMVDVNEINSFLLLTVVAKLYCDGDKIWHVPRLTCPSWFNSLSYFSVTKNHGWIRNVREMYLYLWKFVFLKTSFYIFIHLNAQKNCHFHFSSKLMIFHAYWSTKALRKEILLCLTQVLQGKILTKSNAPWFLLLHVNGLQILPLIWCHIKQICDEVVLYKCILWIQLTCFMYPHYLFDIDHAYLGIEWAISHNKN